MLIARAASRVASASWARSLIPSSVPSSGTSWATTASPSARARSTSSVRYYSPVAGRWRQALDPPPQPGGVERVQAGVDLADLELVGRRVARLDDPRDPVRRRRRITRPSAPGSRSSNDTSATAAPAPRWRSSRPVDEVRLDERDVAVEDHDLGRVGGHGGQGSPDGVAGPVGALLEREGDARGNASRTAAVAGEVDHDRVPSGRRTGGVHDVGEHRAAAQRVQQLRDRRPHAGPQPAGQDDGDGPRPSRASTAAAVPGAHGGGRSSDRLARLRRPGRDGARRIPALPSGVGGSVGIWCPGSVGSVRRPCQTRQPGPGTPSRSASGAQPRNRLDLDAAAFRQGRDRRPWSAPAAGRS